MAQRHGRIRPIAKAIVKLEQSTPVSKQPEVADEIARWIVRAGMSSKFSAIKEEYHRLSDEQRGIVRLTFISARELPKAAQEHTQRAAGTFLGAKGVVATWEAEPSLIGGIRINAGNYEIRSSVRDLLRQL